MLSCCLLCTGAEVTASRTKTLQTSELRWAGGIQVVCFLRKTQIKKKKREKTFFDDFEKPFLSSSYVVVAARQVREQKQKFQQLSPLYPVP